jgi:metal transporter CNNM
MKVVLISAIFQFLLVCCSGTSSSSSYVRRRADVSSDDWAFRLSNNGDDSIITFQAHAPNRSTGSKKVLDFFSNNQDVYSFVLVEEDGEDIIKVRRNTARRNLLQTESEAAEDNEASVFLLTNIFLVFLCVLTAALAAGLTMGLLSLDPLSLEIKRRTSPSMEERKWSETLLPLLLGHSKRHRLMVSLLLMNAIANEALPLFLDELLPGKYASILVSVTLVLFFGEIVPSAFFTGPDQVRVSARLVPLVRVVMTVLSPLAVPIAKLLDRILHDGDGEHVDVEEKDVTEGNYMNRGELGALVRIQYEAQLADKRQRKVNQKLMLSQSSAVVNQASFQRDNSVLSNNSSRSITVDSHTHHSIREIAKEMTVSKNSTLKKMMLLHEDEITMIEGALKMTMKVAADVCTPLRRLYALPSDTVLDEETCVSIWSRGFSRIPIYDGSQHDSNDVVSGILGVLLSRQLIVINPSEKRPLATVPLVLPPCVRVDMHLVDLINMFQAAGGRGKGGLHLAIVCARPDIASDALERGESIPKEAGVVGIVTLEDVVEELLQEEIYDEMDRDLEISRWAVTKWKQFVKRKRLARTKAVAAVTEVTVTEVTPLIA